mmetsp:Transcript_5665/g.8940  ORF Transcript_5665/g.8940 Transcript_5665/m.8940 type:complete len:598 (+) Transcript_5665:105-1898(+)
MVFGLFGNKFSRVTDPDARCCAFEANDDEDEDPTMTREEVGQVQPASALIGSSGISLDGRSLVVPEDGGDEDMSSLGTSKFGYSHGGGDAIGYVGDMRILGRAEEYDNIEEAPDTSYYSPSPRNGRPQRSSMNGGSRNSPMSLGSQSNMEHGDYDFQRNDYSVATGEKTDLSLVEVKQEEEKRKKGRSSCLPGWIYTAPNWLKLVIVTSTALLIGAVILICVGASLVGGQVSSSEQDQHLPGTPTEAPLATSTPSIPYTGGTSAPTATGVESDPTTKYPAGPPLETSVGESPTESSSSPPIEPPFEPPTQDIVTETMKPTTAIPSVSQVNFFAMGGRFDGEGLEALPGQLQTLPNIDGNTILFHLGDWNSPYATSCVEESYSSNVEVYRQSSIPVYFVPGDNEYNDCPNPDQALSFWYDYILGFETKYWPSPTWNISRQTPDFPENFAFLQGKVLFVGINLVGGIVHDQNEWSVRQSANLAWINDRVSTFRGRFNTVVVVAHADPDIDINDNFFGSFYTMVQEYNENVIFMHRNLGIDTWKALPGYNGISNLDILVVEGSLWPPMWVQIDTLTGNYTIDQGSWYQDFLATGQVTSPP